MINDENGWISIKDAEPPRNKWILIHTYKDSCDVAFLRRYKNGKSIWVRRNSGFFDFGEIKHWQPLPKPPKSFDDL